ncbi:sigma-70 family RNA polymerase sigma factor [Gimesia chilikensis]|uniref:sigma-70 family RNA polymerase sigma factor n=1 Tax=Gimesia chilikensis TaxID=2605989 RepID=UPI0011F030F7|nr:sigma-70 family RNA polymerase sigma factor [Gimesia chilikensis]KAA0142891.1 sigma-70 family RNA polymerase sigma factor [Gimesia chilikensis]
MSKLNSQQLLEIYQAGENEAATALFDRYVARLIALARSRIGARLRRRIDPEDIIQSAYRSFFVHARVGEYQLQKTGDLWRLLAGITLHKLYGQIEKHTAGKRSINHEVPPDSILATATVPEPAPSEVVAIIEELSLLIQDLPPEERLVLTASLQGQENAEISSTIGKSERTVRRLLANARNKLEQRLLHHNTPEADSQPPAEEYAAPLRYEDYVLEQLLGSGGMGKVFRARVKGTQQKVAIKALHKKRQSDRRAVSQFVKEAQVLTKLQHPHLVHVEGLGRFPHGGYFMVMDYIDGVDLQSQLETGPFTITEAVSIILHVSDAIGYAHDQGIIHCDLKPANILRDQRGNIRVTDFGFAYLIAGSTTPVNSIGGTAGYLAPEILNRQSLPAPTTDIFSLGVLLWTLITGTLPASPFKLTGVKQQQAPIARIVKRCLSPTPQNRFQTTSELQQALLTLQ